MQTYKHRIEGSHPLLSCWLLQLFAFIAARAHCWLMVSLVSTSPISPEQDHFLPSWNSAHAVAWGWCLPGAQPGSEALY